MSFIRTTLIESFRELLSATDSQLIAITGLSQYSCESFLDSLFVHEVLTGSNTQQIDIDTYAGSESQKNETEETIYTVLRSDRVLDISEIRTFIESYKIVGKIIYTSYTQITEGDISIFDVPGISFREYTAENGITISGGALLRGEIDSDTLRNLRDTYIQCGQYDENLENPDNIPTFFAKKIEEIEQDLFPKEYNDFMEYVRTVAMGVGDLYKEERIAKLMNISRRKVRKYTELVIKYGLMHGIGPYVQDTDTELSRHVKLYFSDLAYYSAALGVAYYHGPSKQGAIENFVLLELERKISSTHEIRFYRKKSGAEIAFVLVNKSTGGLTPIEVMTNEFKAIPQSMKTFETSYHDKVEHYMILDDTHAEQRDLGGKGVIILPHGGI